MYIVREKKRLSDLYFASKEIFCGWKNRSVSLFFSFFSLVQLSHVNNHDKNKKKILVTVKKICHGITSFLAEHKQTIIFSAICKVTNVNEVLAPAAL